MYSGLEVDKEIEVYFLLIYATRDSPKKKAPPLVLFMSSTHLAQSASEYALREKDFLLGYGYEPNTKIA